MSILITGGAGYIGRHTWRLLERSGHHLVLFDRAPIPAAFAGPRTRLVQGDLADKALVRRTLRDHKITAVLHLAASSHVGDSMRQAAAYYANNVTASLTLLDAMGEEHVQRLVFASSCSVYGEAGSRAAREDDAVHPISPYGESKLTLESALPEYARTHGLRWVALRYTNVAGAISDLGEDLATSRHIVPRAACAALGSGSSLAVFGSRYRTPDGSAVRDLVHVTDVAVANRLALEYTASHDAGKILNIGSGDAVSVLQMIHEVSRQTGRDITYLSKPARAGDPAWAVTDRSEAGRILGWSPAASNLQTIVASVLRYHLPFAAVSVDSPEARCVAAARSA